MVDIVMKKNIEDLWIANPEGFKARLAEDRPLKLDSGLSFAPLHIAYQTYGTLNPEKSNAILVCHALTGDQFVASINPFTGEPGWWTELIGSGKVIDPSNYYIICSNILGGCMGTSGPTELNQNDKIFGMQFPVVTIGDMVSAQERLITSLGIEKLFCVIGGSMGGMQVLEWLRRFPDRMISAAAIATSYRNSTQNIAFNEVGRQSIMADPNWMRGKYYKKGVKPKNGLAVARMLAHITYLSHEGMQIKFGRMLQDLDDITYEFKTDFRVQSYLNHQGTKFVNRFDANSYLYLTKAMDYFDLESSTGGDLSLAFASGTSKLFIACFSSDWLFPISESIELVKAMKTAGRDVIFREFKSSKGHDAFLLDEPEFHDSLNKFLNP